VVANNWVEVTRGPLCITGIPKPTLAGLAITTLPAYYWLALGTLAGVALALPRADDVPPGARLPRRARQRPLAAPRRSTRSSTAARLHDRRRAGRRPSARSTSTTLGDVPGGDDRGAHRQPARDRLLGGVGSLRGVLVGAVLFTALPEVLRLAPTWRLVIYGALLLLVVIRSPGGLESLLRRAGAR
jgi:branched-chain amino acid transport system permease protein